MMLKTSSRSLNPAFGMFKTTLRKNLGLIILLSVGVLLYCPGYFFTSLGRTMFERQPDCEENFIRMGNGFIFLMCVIACGAVFLFNLINFMFLYSKRSSDVFHALPLTRTEMVLSRCASGFVFALIPIVLGFCALSVLNCFVLYPLSFTHIALCFAFILAFMLVCSTFSMLFVVCAGNAFDLAISFCGFNIALIIVGIIISNMLDELLIGFGGGLSFDILGNISPAVYCGAMFYTAVFDGLNLSDTTAYFVRCIVYSAVFGIVSVLLYNHRKSERGGQAYAYRFIYVLCSLACSFCGAFALGAMFSGGSFKSLQFWVFAVIGGILTAVIYGAVTNRGFKNVKISVVSGIASVAVMGIIGIGIAFGGFGYTERVPDIGDIKSADVYISGFSTSDNIEFKNPELPREIHKTILKEKLYVDNNGVISDVARDYEYDNISYISFDYQLKNGKLMHREYSIRGKRGDELLFKLCQSDERFDTIEKKINSSGVATVNLGYYDNSGSDEIYGEAYLTVSECKKFMQLYREDIKKVDNASEFLNGYDSSYELSWNNADGSHYYYTLQINGLFENTKEYLESLDLPARAADIKG